MVERSALLGKVYIAGLVLLMMWMGHFAVAQAKKADWPLEYQHAQRMLEALGKQGIHIREIGSSNTGELFKTKPSDAMFIRSDEGIFELIHLENKGGKGLSIEKIPGRAARYAYAIKQNGKETNRFGSIAETFFNINSEYVSVTRDKELNGKIKKAFETQK